VIWKRTIIIIINCLCISCGFCSFVIFVLMCYLCNSFVFVVSFLPLVYMFLLLSFCPFVFECAVSVIGFFAVDSLL